MIKLGKKRIAKRGLANINRPARRKRRCKNRREMLKAFNYQFKGSQAPLVASQSA